jgi:hypothetical protein
MHLVTPVMIFTGMYSILFYSYFLSITVLFHYMHHFYDVNVSMMLILIGACVLVGGWVVGGALTSLPVCSMLTYQQWFSIAGLSSRSLFAGDN